MARYSQLAGGADSVAAEPHQLAVVIVKNELVRSPQRLDVVGAPAANLRKFAALCAERTGVKEVVDVYVYEHRSQSYRPVRDIAELRAANLTSNDTLQVPLKVQLRRRAGEYMFDAWKQQEKSAEAMCNERLQLSVEAETEPVRPSLASTHASVGETSELTGVGTPSRRVSVATTKVVVSKDKKMWEVTTLARVGSMLSTSTGTPSRLSVFVYVVLAINVLAVTVCTDIVVRDPGQSEAEFVANTTANDSKHDVQSLLILLAQGVNTFFDLYLFSSLCVVIGPRGRRDSCLQQIVDGAKVPRVSAFLLCAWLFAPFLHNMWVLCFNTRRYAEHLGAALRAKDQWYTLVHNYGNVYTGIPAWVFPILILRLHIRVSVQLCWFFVIALATVVVHHRISDLVHRTRDHIHFIAETHNDRLLRNPTLAKNWRKPKVGTDEIEGGDDHKGLRHTRADSVHEDWQLWIMQPCVKLAAETIPLISCLGNGIAALWLFFFVDVFMHTGAALDLNTGVDGGSDPDLVFKARQQLALAGSYTLFPLAPVMIARAGERLLGMLNEVRLQHNTDVLEHNRVLAVETALRNTNAAQGIGLKVPLLGVLTAGRVKGYLVVLVGSVVPFVLQILGDHIHTSSTHVCALAKDQDEKLTSCFKSSCWTDLNLNQSCSYNWTFVS